MAGMADADIHAKLDTIISELTDLHTRIDELEDLVVELKNT